MEPVALGKTGLTDNVILVTTSKEDVFQSAPITPPTNLRFVIGTPVFCEENATLVSARGDTVHVYATSGSGAKARPGASNSPAVQLEWDLGGSSKWRFSLDVTWFGLGCVEGGYIIYNS